MRSVFRILPVASALAALVVLLQLASKACEAFSVPSPLACPRSATPPLQEPRSRSSRLGMATEVGEELVTLRSLSFTVEGRPMGVILEEMADGVGVFCSEVEEDGPAYAAGLRDGDVLVSLGGDESISKSTLDGAMAMLGSAPMPLPVGVYRELTEEENPSRVRGSTVKMAPRRLPSTKKLLRASTNANFWKDPIMLGSAVLTVAMPLGIYLASSLLGDK